MPDTVLSHPDSGHGTGSSSAVDLVVVGHVGLATNHTKSGTVKSPGGSGYAVGVGASVMSASRVGLVSQVGHDFDLHLLWDLGLNMEGVAVLPGPSAKFYIEEFRDGTRSFRSDLGVAATARFDLFPTSYFQAEVVHIGTAPPKQQLSWLKFLRDSGCQALISADMFEYFVATQADASCEVCELADLIFMNKMEYNGLYGGTSTPKAPMVVKHGSEGADYLVDGATHHVSAPSACVVDSTGAGEVLAGVFLALRVHGLPETQALRYAVQVATSCVTEFGVNGPNVAAALAAIRKEIQPRIRE